MRSGRLGFGVWEDADISLAAAIWGDPEVTKLIGGPFTPQRVRDRPDNEITKVTDGHRDGSGARYVGLELPNA